MKSTKELFVKGLEKLREHAYENNPNLITINVFHKKLVDSGFSFAEASDIAGSMKIDVIPFFVEDKELFDLTIDVMVECMKRLKSKITYVSLFRSIVKNKPIVLKFFEGTCTISLNYFS